MTKQRIAVFALGGTIAMAQESPGKGAVPTRGIEDLLATAPGLAERCELIPRQFRQLPGSELTIGDIIDLATEIEAGFAAGAAGAVVTQGTDTIEETAFTLDCLLPGDKPVVVTGAMRHSGLPGPDGPANIVNAVSLASFPEARGCGVLVALNDDIHAARYVRKSHTSKPDAFSSPTTGPVGCISEGFVHMFTRPARTASLNGSFSEKDKHVGLITASLGDDGRLLEYVGEAGFDGLVVEALGGGHLPKAMAEHLERLAKDMPVVLASRAGAGVTLRNTYGFPGSEMDLLRRGMIWSGRLDGPKSRIALTLMLKLGRTQEEIQAYFQ